MNLKRQRGVLRRHRFFHFHVNIKYRLNREIEEKGIVARYCCLGLSPAGGPLPAGAPAGDNPGQRATGNRQRSAGSRAPVGSGAPAGHVAVLNSFSTMAEITPTTSLVVEIPENLREPDAVLSFHQMGDLCKLTLLRVMCHNTNSRTVVQITKNTCVMWRSHGRSSLSHWRAKFSGRAKQRKGR